MYIISGNYGDNTLALIQWAKEAALAPVTVVHIDTGWAAQSWQAHVSAGQALVQRYDFTPTTITAKHSFEALVHDRGRFPSQKFQWCAGFLKGLPLLAWLDEIDPDYQATLLLGARRADSRVHTDLPEWLEESEHHGGRRVHYPLYKHDTPARDALISKTGLPILGHRSLECDPCIHSARQSLSPASQSRLAALEAKIGEPMALPATDPSLEQFDMGCGMPYGCGE